MKLRILITGGAGFVGSHLAVLYRKKYPRANIDVLDNLSRKGSEKNLRLLKSNKINFIKGDIGKASTFKKLKAADLVVDCAAEASVLGGIRVGSMSKLLSSNLIGTQNTLEWIRQKNPKALLLFLSTSRVYSLEMLKEIPLKSNASRFELNKKNQKLKSIQGLSSLGITETFSTQGAKSFYGFSKFASEELIREYIYGYGLNAVISRCGVLSGERQRGLVEQGFLSLWFKSFLHNKELKYFGFGGKGFQVRDLLHPEDLFYALNAQTENLHKHNGRVYNLGGSLSGSLSLREVSQLCEKLTGNKSLISSQKESHMWDIPWYISDCALAKKELNWAPRIAPEEIGERILRWLKEEERLSVKRGGSKRI